MLIESAIINSMSGTDTNHFFWFNDCQSYNTINKFSFKEILFSLYSKQINISPIYRPSIISTRLVDSDGYHKNMMMYYSILNLERAYVERCLNEINYCARRLSISN